ncbi:hypothetical protein [Nakamurella deserti]|uniref:hypothetical protein n=1 Tax=Nakamurella deserti TaxID=2164074 RepID=UPI000DBE38E5|nr:hypothetical protein [Nakamurella deserti]
MESSLPFAVRVAAGLLSEAVGRARRLPADLTTLPVSVIGQVAKFSFELNQQLAELATEGDRLLAGLHGGDEPPQRTAWSTIDDEDEVAAKDPQAAATWDTSTPDTAAPDTTAAPTTAADPGSTAPGTGAPGLVLDDEPPVPSASPRLVRDEDAPVPPRATTGATGTGRPAPRTPSVRRPRTGGRADAAGTLVGAAGDSAGAVVGAGTSPTTHPERTDVPAATSLLGDIHELEVDRPAPLVGLPSAEDHPPTDISAMTIGQLRSRVRSWGSEQVRAALEQEQREKARPAFLTVLTNRLSTLARGGA